MTGEEEFQLHVTTPTYATHPMQTHGQTDGRTDGSHTKVITIAHPKHSSGDLKILSPLV